MTTHFRKLSEDELYRTLGSDFVEQLEAEYDLDFSGGAVVATAQSAAPLDRADVERLLKHKADPQLPLLILADSGFSDEGLLAVGDYEDVIPCHKQKGHWRPIIPA